MDTIAYYNQNAKQFYDNTVNADMREHYQHFLKDIKIGGHILDAGCGSGRDSLFFLEQGYEVTALDASKELVKLSSSLLKQDVLHMRFQEMEFNEEFDGVWVSASLLHINREKIENVINRLSKSLVNTGVMYLSFKYGNKEVNRNGRFFNYYDEDSFAKLISKFEELEVIKISKTEDVRDGREDEYWLNILLKKVDRKDTIQ